MLSVSTCGVLVLNLLSVQNAKLRCFSRGLCSTSISVTITHYYYYGQSRQQDEIDNCDYSQGKELYNSRYPNSRLIMGMDHGPQLEIYHWNGQFANLRCFTGTECGLFPNLRSVTRID